MTNLEKLLIIIADILDTDCTEIKINYDISLNITLVEYLYHTLGPNVVKELHSNHYDILSMAWAEYLSENINFSDPTTLEAYRQHDIERIRADFDYEYRISELFDEKLRPYLFFAAIYHDHVQDLIHDESLNQKINHLKTNLLEYNSFHKDFLIENIPDWYDTDKEFLTFIGYSRSLYTDEQIEQYIRSISE